jgi:hypothetical protein
MDARLREAVINNARWCDAVCRSHGLPTSLGERVWIAPRGSPPLYPDVITLLPGLAPDAVLGEVGAAPGCSVKDSFADVDLGRRGFIELFEARWIFRKPPRGQAPPRLHWGTAATAEDLAHWTDAAGLQRIIRPGLLGEAGVRVLLTRDQQGIAAGAVANRSGSVVGLSNVFTTRLDDRAAWAELPAIVADLFGRLPIVGYEHGDALDSRCRKWLRADRSAAGLAEIAVGSNHSARGAPS